MPLIPVTQLRTISINIFTAIGLKADKAQTIANLLIESNLAGHDSHGVLRLPQYVLSIQSKTIDPDVEIEIVSETPSSAIIDGHSGLGQFIATQAMEVAIAKAREHTISTVNVYNCNHIGRLADYVKMAAEAKMVGMLFLNGHGGDHGVAPWGGTDRRLSTNPFACALPTGKDSPMIIDLTTSIVAGGKIRAYRSRGEPLPEGWILDADGNPSTDPNAYLEDPQGPLLPFGDIAGHKGYGLSLMTDILAGAMCEAGCSRSSSPGAGNAFFIIVIDIEKFIALADFEAHVAQMIDFVKASPTAPGFDEISIPGERSARTRQQRLAEGIPLDDTTWERLVETAQSVRVSV
jgi:uncharacterized oxidoreductase